MYYSTQNVEGESMGMYVLGYVCIFNVWGFFLKNLKNSTLKGSQ